jgi:predicted DNA-binding transcriptional regulator AlpA
MQNPFSELDQRLTSIESILLELQASLSRPKVDASRLPINIDRVSALSNLAKPTIYGLVGAKKIPHAKQGKKLYFFEDEIIDWIRQGKRKTLTEIEAEAAAHLENRRQRKA